MLEVISLIIATLYQIKKNLSFFIDKDKDFEVRGERPFKEVRG